MSEPTDEQFIAAKRIVDGIAGFRQSALPHEYLQVARLIAVHGEKHVEDALRRLPKYALSPSPSTPAPTTEEE